jgi:hypothetical protein
MHLHGYERFDINNHDIYIYNTILEHTHVGGEDLFSLEPSPLSKGLTVLILKILTFLEFVNLSKLSIQALKPRGSRYIIVCGWLQHLCVELFIYFEF